MAKLTPDEWIPLFTKHFKDEQILNPVFSMTFDHCKLCDTHVEPGEQKDHMRQHKRELATFRRKQRIRAERERHANLAKARKVRSS